MTDDETVPAIVTDGVDVADRPAIPRQIGRDIPPSPHPRRPVADGERLVLGLAQGPTLAELTDRGPMRVREVVRIGTQAATLLAALHDRGRAHGAVTPVNIVLGPGGRVALAEPAVPTNSQVEVGDGRPAEDVHDLGVALSRALTGVDDGPLPADLPRALGRALHAATDPDPERRPSARQVADMLRWVGRAEPARAAEPRWSTSGAAAWAIGGGALVILLLVLVGVAVLRADPANPAAPAAPAAPATPSAIPAPTTVAPTSAAPTGSAAPTPTGNPIPTGLPTSLPTTLPSIEIPTTLPSLPSLPTALPELPAEARSLWNRFVEWLKGLF